jgi:fatty-acyl-CoA synthase
MSPGNAVLSEDRKSVLSAGADTVGWWARRQYVPLGYLDDEAATRAAFVEIEGVRYSVPGDRAQLLADGHVRLLGRDSLVINSGGEKVYAEEVEAALQRHPAVKDVLVVSRPDERWGRKVVAVVERVPGASCSEDELLEEAGRHLSRYKLPKAFLFVGKLERNPNGKPDYKWAQQQADAAGL